MNAINYTLGIKPNNHQRARMTLLKHTLTFLTFSALAVTAGATTVADKTPIIVSTDASVNAMNAGIKPVNNGIYIVQFKAPPVARYTGGIKSLNATSPATRSTRGINRNDAAVKAYVNHLGTQREAFRTELNAGLRRGDSVLFDYRYAINGVALRLSPAEAQQVAKMSDVVSVSADVLYPLHTNAGPTFIGASQIWDGSTTFSGVGTQGEGQIIGIIDSGVNSDHPSFAAVGGDGFVHTNPLGTGNFTGRCGLPMEDPLFFGGCNDKLIGAHDFVDAVQAEENNDGPEDENDHGSHVASTAGGNIVSATLTAPTINLAVELSGVAPHANIIACDACFTNAAGLGRCPGSATTACVDALVGDGVDVINYSIGGGVNPWQDPVSLGFLDATAAGIYVSASGGNSGPSAATLGHNEPWVGTTAASSHDGARVNQLISLTSDGASLQDIDGVSFSAGFGPAPIVYAGEFANPNNPDGDPAQCLEPYPAGTFSGQIVVCDRGGIARTAKGENVLSGGAGGFVLANLDAQAESIAADPHALPATHIGDTAGDDLRAWLATNTNTMATLTATESGTLAAFGDIVAGFSSRGPSGVAGLLKPDVTAPGSSILAAVSNSASPPEFGLLSGTSMSSPHHAGSATLLKNIFPAWSPYEIKSAIMMTGVSAGVLKEDSATPSDPFDIGAGRVDLTRAALTGLVMSETAANMLAADPDNGGDPASLNIASMQDNACSIDCSWTRTFTSVSDNTIAWSASGSSTTGLAVEIVPATFTLAPGASQTVVISANTIGANSNAWNFGQVKLTEDSGSHPDLALPVAAFAQNGSDLALVTKSVSANQVNSTDTVTYTINMTNSGADQEITISDELPPGTSFVENSATQTVIDGTTIDDWTYDVGTNTLTWTGNIDGQSSLLNPGTSPDGFVSLAALGVPAAPCPNDCDDGGLLIGGLSFDYFGENFTSAVWSVNGTLELGTDAGIATTALNQNLPNGAGPNNILAPFWTDMNLTDGGNWFTSNVMTNGVGFRVFSWENVPRFDDPTTYSFQIWLETDGSRFWFVYDRIPVVPAGLTVGYEDATGTQGVSTFFNGIGTAPAVGTDLAGVALPPGSVTLTFDTVLTGSQGDVITNTAEVTGDTVKGSAFVFTELSSGGVDTDGDGVNDTLDSCTLVANTTQLDTNGDGFGNACDPDLNNDGIVNFLDVGIFAGLFNTSNGGDADINGDGNVNFIDFAAFQSFFLNPPGPSGLNP